MDNKHNKYNEPIPLHRVAVVRPFTRLLEDIGAPVERGFQQTGLPWYAMEDIDNYIPSHGFWKFLINMSRAEGIMDLGFRVGKKYGAECADPHMKALLSEAPTLYQGLLNASKMINRTVSHCTVGILQPHNCDYAFFFHQPSCDADNPAIEQIGWFGLETLIGMARVYTGPQWQPSEIGCMARDAPCRSIREHFPHTRIRLSQPFSYITLENAVLSLPPLSVDTAVPSPSQLDYQSLPDDLFNSLEMVLLSYIQEKDLNLELAAGLCNMSKRTLQRHLMKSGTKYSDVLDRARFRAATRMLQIPGLTVTDISRRLGYNNVANFARTFRRIAGVTPGVYRQQSPQQM